jgi:hypothetical protein
MADTAVLFYLRDEMLTVSLPWENVFSLQLLLLGSGVTAVLFFREMVTTILC